MVNKDKFRERLLRKQTPKDIKWTDLRNFLLGLGFEEVQGSGSRVRFYEPGKSGTRGLMIRDVAQTLKSWGLL